MYREAHPDLHEAGFTIIEVLVALALVAVCLGAIGQVVATTARGTRMVEQRVALVETARSIAASLPSGDQLAAGSSSGETAGHHWQIDVAPWTGGGVAQVANSPWVPQAVRIRVRSSSGATISIETARLQKRPNG